MGEKRHAQFRGKKLEERYHLGNLGINGNIILDLEEVQWEGVGWISLAQYSYKW